MSLQDIREALTSLAKQVADVKAVYDYPVTELGRDLPALTIIYDGFEQRPGPALSTDVDWIFEMALYIPFDGRSAKTPSRTMEELAEAVLAKFRANPGLLSTCWIHTIQSGQPVLEVPDEPTGKPRWVGHTFRLLARNEET